MPAQVKQLSKETQPSQAGRPAQTKPGTKVKQPTRTTQPVEAKQTTEAKLATIKAKEPSAVSTSRLITTESISPPIRERFAYLLQTRRRVDENIVERVATLACILLPTFFDFHTLITRATKLLQLATKPDFNAC